MFTAFRSARRATKQTPLSDLVTVYTLFNWSGCISICCHLAQSFLVSQWPAVVYSAASLSCPSLICRAGQVCCLCQFAYLILCSVHPSSYRSLARVVHFGAVSVNCRHWKLWLGTSEQSLNPLGSNLDRRTQSGHLSKCDLTRRLVLIFFFLCSVYYN